MTQTILYWVEENGVNRISDDEWSDIDYLQKRINIREYLHCGRVGLLRFTYTPRWPQLYSDSMLPETLGPEETEKHLEDLIDRGWTWEDLVQRNLAARVPGGLYASDCLLAGCSEVSDFQGDIKTVMRFFLKASMIAQDCVFRVAVDGDLQIKDFTVERGSIRPDEQAIADRFGEYCKTGQSDAAADLLEAIEDGDFLRPQAADSPGRGDVPCQA